MEWPAEGGHETTSPLFPSLLAREPRRYLENAVLTKPREAGHNSSLPLDSRQNTFCLPTRALEVLAHRCHLVATLQAACSRDSVLAPLTYGARGVRTETTGGILSPLRLLKMGRVSTKSYFFTPYSFFSITKVQNVPFLPGGLCWLFPSVSALPSFFQQSESLWSKQASFWKDSPWH